jgi:hypothetical protein
MKMAEFSHFPTISHIVERELFAREDNLGGVAAPPYRRKADGGRFRPVWPMRKGPKIRFRSVSVGLGECGFPNSEFGMRQGEKREQAPALHNAPDLIWAASQVLPDWQHSTVEGVSDVRVRQSLALPTESRRGVWSKSR